MTALQERTAAKHAETRYPIHDLLRRRWSPRAFADWPVAPETLHRMFEAARWAPSAGNGQPWGFIVATRDDETEFARLLGVLNEKNQAWAQDAAVLVLTVTAIRRPDGKEHRLALYDLGLAVENLIVEGMAHDIFAHQMGGFDAEAARRVFAIPDSHVPVSVIALGYPGDPEALPAEQRERELSPRARKPLDEIVFRGRFGQPTPLVLAEAATLTPCPPRPCAREGEQPISSQAVPPRLQGGRGGQGVRAVPSAQNTQKPPIRG